MESLRGLPVEIRRKAYQLALDIYEAFEALPERGVLVHDIESTANRLIKLVAAFTVTDSKNKLLSDIFAELKGLRALLGIVRDTSILERQPSMSLMDKVVSLDELLHKESAEYAVRSTDLSLRNESGRDSVSELRVGPQSDIKPPSIVEKHPPATGMIIEKKPSLDIGLNKPETESPVSRKPAGSSDSSRQQAIIEVLKRRPKVSVGELDTLFSQRVSKKTLQRDLQGLIDRNIVERHGDKRWATYSLREAAVSSQSGSGI